MMKSKWRATTIPFVAFAAVVTASITFAQPPNQPPGDGARRGAPPEAVAACRGKSESATCSFTAPFGEATGTCRRGPDGSSTLACMPAGGPPPPR